MLTAYNGAYVRSSGADREGPPIVCWANNSPNAPNNSIHSHYTHGQAYRYGNGTTEGYGKW